MAKSPFDEIYNYDPNDPEPLEHLIPPKIYYLAMHLHNLIYIRYFYETLGQQPPAWTKGEMERSQTHLLKQLDLEHGQGGKFRKEMKDETGQSEPGSEGELEGGAKRQGRVTRRY